MRGLGPTGGPNATLIACVAECREAGSAIGFAMTASRSPALGFCTGFLLGLVVVALWRRAARPRRAQSVDGS